MMSRLSPLFRGAVSVYGLATLLCLLILVKAFHLGRTALDVPLKYSGDAVLHMGWIKNIADTGWYLRNDRFGVPGGQDVRSFPGADTLHHGLFKLLACFTDDVAVLFNAFYLLTFPLTTLTTVFVLRRLGVSAGIATAAALLYTFLPYHFYRMGHLFLAAYYLVPVAGLMAVRLYQDRPFLAREGDARGWQWHDTLAAVLTCVAVGLGGIYYAFFACYFFVVAGLACSLRQRRTAPVRRAVAMAAGVTLFVVAAVLPTLLQRWEEGLNPDDAQRTAFESEFYGLKVIQMLLPVPDHQVPLLRELAAEYNAFAPLVTENQQACLGLVGGLGVLVLLGRVLLQLRAREPGALIDALALLATAAVLLGTVGGLGMLFSYLFSPWIRAYNRISICVGFFALAAVAILLEAARQRWATTPLRRGVFMVLVLTLLTGGLVDQMPRHRLPNHSEEQAAFRSDRAFVRELESHVPAGGNVCQWPYRPYPEPPREAKGIRFYAYDLLRPHLHSRTLRWTYGSSRGHAGDAWCRRLDGLPLEEQLRTLCRADFAGVCIDTAAYPDQAEALTGQLGERLGPPTVTSPDGRLQFFDLAPLTERLRAGVTPARWADLHDRALHPVLLFWRKGFFEEEAGPSGVYRWVASDAELIVANHGRQPARVRLGFSFEHPDHDTAYTLNVESELFSEAVSLRNRETRLDRVVDVPPGEYRVRLWTDAKPQRRGRDAKRRPIVYRVFGVRCDDASPQ